MTELVTHYTKGCLTRRNFIKGLTALGISMTSINTILSKSASAEMASNPKQGGRFRQGMAGGGRQQIPWALPL